VLDVWEGEPAINHQLLRLTRYGTPHIAGYSLDGKLLATRMLVEGMALELGLPWRDPGSAAVEPAPLQVTAQDTGADLLRSVISQRYAIAADDAALRQATLGVDVAAAASGFDRLRREYPERREILGSRVRLQPSGAREQRLLAGLGCLVGSVEE
jgi:erythronate-4-phosphate dehydrogenase